MTINKLCRKELGMDLISPSQRLAFYLLISKTSQFGKQKHYERTGMKKGIGKMAWLVIALALCVMAATGWAQGMAVEARDGSDAVKAGMSDMRVALDTVWVLLAGMLVFWMNAGFAMVESGLCRSKNCVNILAKNFIVFALATLSFWILGWGLMFGDGSPWVGLKGLFFVSGADNSPALGAGYAAMNPFSSDTYAGVYSAINWTPVPLWAKFFFQLVFAGTAATIVSGAVAERIKFKAFLIFSLLLVGVIYPVSGHWIWGGGVLAAAKAPEGLNAFFHNFRALRVRQDRIGRGHRAHRRRDRCGVGAVFRPRAH